MIIKAFIFMSVNAFKVGLMTPHVLFFSKIVECCLCLQQMCDNYLNESVVFEFFEREQETDIHQ